MTVASSITNLIGSFPAGNFNTPDIVQRHVLGTVFNVVDPYWGGRELIYLQFSFATGTPLRTGAVLAYDEATPFVATLVANAANLGKSVAFNLQAIPSTAPSGTYFLWAVISGACPVWSSAAVAANTAIGIVAAGQAGANSLGKQLMNCRSTRPSSFTIARANSSIRSGSSILQVPTTDGFIVGGVVTSSPAGIPASTTILAIDADDRTIILSAAATATALITATHNFVDGSNHYNIVTCDRPFAQGAIT